MFNREHFRPSFFPLCKWTHTHKRTHRKEIAVPFLPRSHCSTLLCRGPRSLLIRMRMKIDQNETGHKICKFLLITLSLHNNGLHASPCRCVVVRRCNKMRRDEKWWNWGAYCRVNGTTSYQMECSRWIAHHVMEPCCMELTAVTPCLNTGSIFRFHFHFQSECV